MATNVTFNGVVYSVPTNAGESGWASTLSAYLQALASGAATTSTVKQNIRTATNSPVTVVAATDYTVVTNLSVAGPVTVNLPAGVAKQIFVIVDGKGDAGTNNVTIDADGTETINGAATYVINENFGGIMLQFDGTGWVIIASFYGTSASFTNLTVTSTATVGTLAATTISGGTLSGVTLDGDTNTVQDLPVTAIKTVLADANKVLRRNASGVPESGLLVDANIDTAAGIVDTKLATISTALKVSNSATTATNSNTANAIVSRDASGNFSAGTISAALIGNVTGNVSGTAANVTGIVATANGGTGLSAIGSALQVLRTNAGASALEWANAAGDVAGAASSVDSEIVLFSSTTGKVIKRATGTGYVKVSSGVYQTPSATIPSGDILGRTDGLAPSAGYVGQVIQASGTGSTGTLSTHLTEVDVSNSVLTLPVGFWQINYMVQGTVNGACTTNTGFYNGADIVLKINVNGGGYTNLTTFRNVVIEPGDIARSVTAVPHLIGCISYTLVVNVTTGTTLIKATGRANFFGFTSVANVVDTIVTPYAVRIA